MTLQEDLKAKALALISQQMANWVVDIQRQIGEHQGNLVRTLDDLQESVARYDEKINESDIEMAMAEVVANMPPPEPAAPVGPGFDQLKASLATLEKGTSLSEVLTHLVNEVAQYVDRAAMFIVKGPSAIGWYARGVEPADVIKQVNVPLNADTVLRNVNNSRHALRGAMDALAGHRAGAGQARRQPAGRPGRAADPARQAGRDPVLRHRAGRGPAARRRPHRDPRPLRGQDHRHALARAQDGHHRPAGRCSVGGPRPPAPPAARPAAAAAVPRAPADEGGLDGDVQRAADERVAPAGAAAPRPAAPPPPPPLLPPRPPCRRRRRRRTRTPSASPASS